MAAFAQWLSGFVHTALIWLYNQLIDLLQYLSDGLADFLVSIIGLFPQGSAMPVAPSRPSGDLAEVLIVGMNWLLPMEYFSSLLTWTIAAMLAYLLVAPFAKRLI